jgi:hypothetical protein
MSTAEAIAEAIRALASAAPESAAALGDEQLCSRADAVEQLGRLVDALRPTVASRHEIAPRGRGMIGSRHNRVTA